MGIELGGSAWGFIGPNFEDLAGNRAATTVDSTAFQRRVARRGSLATRLRNVRCFHGAGRSNRRSSHQGFWAVHERGQDWPQRERKGNADAVLSAVVVCPISARIRRDALVDPQSLTTDFQIVAAARIAWLKPGATCDRRSAAKIGDSAYFPTGEYGEPPPATGPNCFFYGRLGCHVRLALSLHPVNSYRAASRICFHAFLRFCKTLEAIPIRRRPASCDGPPAVRPTNPR